MPIEGNNMHANTEAARVAAIAEADRKMAERKAAVLAAAEKVEKAKGEKAAEPVTVAVTKPKVEKSVVTEATSEAVLDPDAPRDTLEKQLLELRNPPPVVDYPAPKPTERQWARTLEEMEAGKKRVAAAREQQAQRPQVKPDVAREGTSVPVFRGAEYQHEKGESKGKK